MAQLSRPEKVVDNGCNSHPRNSPSGHLCEQPESPVFYVKRAVPLFHRQGVTRFNRLYIGQVPIGSGHGGHHPHPVETSAETDTHKNQTICYPYDISPSGHRWPPRESNSAIPVTRRPPVSRQQQSRNHRFVLSPDVNRDSCWLCFRIRLARNAINPLGTCPIFSATRMERAQAVGYASVLVESRQLGRIRWRSRLPAVGKGDSVHPDAPTPLGIQTAKTVSYRRVGYIGLPASLNDKAMPIGSQRTRIR